MVLENRATPGVVATVANMLFEQARDSGGASGCSPQNCSTGR